MSIRARVPELTKFEWQKAVIEIRNDPPTNPRKGDRYIIDYNSTGIWSDKSEQIGEYDETDGWFYTMCQDGMVTYVIHDDMYFQYINNMWRPLPNLAKRKVKKVNTNYELLLSDAGSVIVSDTTSLIDYMLPSVIEDDVGIEYFFSRLGTGELVIHANDDMVIEDSSINGCIENQTVKDNSSASLSLRLIDTTSWIITSGNGTWVTF